MSTVDGLYGLFGIIVFFMIPIAVIRLAYLRIKKRPYAEPRGLWWLTLIFMAPVRAIVFVPVPAILWFGIISKEQTTAGEAALISTAIDLPLAFLASLVVAWLWLKSFDAIKKKILTQSSTVED